jgi:inner membrane transporter RhtA
MPPHRHASFLPFLCILGSVLFLALGTSLAKHALFPVIGAQGTTAVRVGFSALVLLALWRPWRWPLSRPHRRAVLYYGAALGMMNLCFYMALRTIPFGIAVAIEFAGPLGVALCASRRRLDFAWIVLAAAGLAILLPVGHAAGGLDRTGLLYAVGAATFWALYILCGKRVGALHAGHSVSLGLATAALLVVPVGLPYAGAALLSPMVLATGLVVAILSSAVPISLEMMALKRLPPQAFGIMISMEPAVAALVAMFVLDEFLGVAQWLAIGLIMTASVGITLTTPKIGGAGAVVT